jgi:hypothetical protein
MSEFCRQCAVSHRFLPPHDAVMRQDLGPLPEGHGFPTLCEGCGPTLTDYLGHCLGGCEGDYFNPTDKHTTVKKIYRTFAEAQEVYRMEVHCG